MIHHSAAARLRISQLSTANTIRPYRRNDSTSLYISAACAQIRARTTQGRLAARGFNSVEQTHKKKRSERGAGDPIMGTKFKLEMRVGAEAEVAASMERDKPCFHTPRICGAWK